MLPFVHSHFGRGARSKAVFVAAGTRVQGDPSVPLNLAAVVGPGGHTPSPGDMMVVCASISGGSGAAWTVLPSGARVRVLNAADISTPFTLAAGPAAWAIYRGPVMATVKSSRSNTNAHIHTGFVKSKACLAVLLVGRENSGTSARITIGAPWAQRAMGYGGGGSGPAETIYDLLDTELYVDGASVIASASSNPTSWSDLVELTF